MPLIPFSCFFAVARTSIVMVNKSDECRKLCFVPRLRGKTFSFLLLSMMLAGVLGGLFFCFVDGPYYVEVASLYAHFLESFYRKWVLNFVKSFFCTY